MTDPRPKPADRRSARRRRVKRSTRAACREGSHGLGPNLAVAALDLSETGVRLAVTVPLERGDEVEVTLEGVGSQRPVKLAARVAWSAPAPGGGHVAGLAFAGRLDYHDLTCLAYD